MPILSEVNFFVVAHPDDIELFMARSLMSSIREKKETVLVVLTAGDDGKGYQGASESSYWYARNHGHERAVMFLVNNLHNGIKIKKTQPPSARFNNVYLYNLMLPDRPLQKLNGTPRTALSDLESGAVATLNTIDQKFTFTRNQLVQRIFLLFKKHTGLLRIPNLHVTNEGSELASDHLDHHVTTRLAIESFSRVRKRHSRISRYQTYLNEHVDPNFSRAETLLHAATWGIYNACILPHFPALSGRMQTKWLGKQVLTATSDDAQDHPS